MGSCHSVREYTSSGVVRLQRVCRGMGGGWGGGGFNLDLLENRESHRSEFFISAQRDRSAVVCEISHVCERN